MNIIFDFYEIFHLTKSHKNHILKEHYDFGAMAERLNAPVLKTGIWVTISGVQIPLAPNLFLYAHFKEAW